VAKRAQTSTTTKRSQAKKQAAKKATSKACKKTKSAKTAKTARAGTSTGKGNATRKTPTAKRKATKTTVRATAVKSKASKTATAKKAVTGQSAKKKSVAKKRTGKATRAAADSPVDAPPPEPPPPKTYLNEKDLAHFRELLLIKRAELAGDVNRLASEALNSKGSAHGEQSAMPIHMADLVPIHMADLGTDNWEQEFTLGLLENEQALVREIDEALARIHDLTYGMCLATRKRISKARLRAKPWAKYCIEYARAREEGRLT